jgi:hypothetical protein
MENEAETHQHPQQGLRSCGTETQGYRLSWNRGVSWPKSYLMKSESGFLAGVSASVFAGDYEDGM